MKGIREDVGGYNFVHEMIIEARTNQTRLGILQDIFRGHPETPLDLINVRTDSVAKPYFPAGFTPLHLACAQASTPRQTMVEVLLFKRLCAFRLARVYWRMGKKKTKGDRVPVATQSQRMELRLERESLQSRSSRIPILCDWVATGDGLCATELRLTTGLKPL